MRILTGNIRDGYVSHLHKEGDDVFMNHFLSCPLSLPFLLVGVNKDKSVFAPFCGLASWRYCHRDTRDKWTCYPSYSPLMQLLIGTWMRGNPSSLPYKLHVNGGVQVPPNADVLLSWSDA